MAGEVGYGFTLPAAHHQGLEAGQLFRSEGLIVAQVEVQAAQAQDVGQKHLGGGPGLGNALFPEIIGGPAEELQDGPGVWGGGRHLRLFQGLGAIMGGQRLEKFIQVAVQRGFHLQAMDG